MEQQDFSLQLNSKRILILEDEFILGEDLRMQLEDLGYEVVAVADTVEKALTVVEEKQPDLALLDIQLGDDPSAGIRLAEILRTQYQIPFIFLSSHTSSKVIQIAKTTRAHGYLIKPAAKDALMAAIEVALHKAAYEDISRQEREKNVLLQLGNTIATVRDQKDLFLFIQQQLQPTLGFAAAVALMADPCGQNFERYDLAHEGAINSTSDNPLSAEPAVLPLSDPLLAFLAGDQQQCQLQPVSLLKDVDQNDVFSSLAVANRASTFTCLQFRDEQQYIGFLILFYQGRNPAIEWEESFLYGVANQFSLAVSNIRTYQELLRQERNKRIKLQLVDILNRNEDWPDTLLQCVTTLQAYLPFSAVSFWFSPPEEDKIVLLERIGRSDYRTLLATDLSRLLRCSKDELLDWSFDEVGQEGELVSTANYAEVKTRRPLHRHLAQVFGFSHYLSFSGELGPCNAYSLIFHGKGEMNFTRSQHEMLTDILNKFTLSLEKHLAYQTIKELSNRLEQERNYLEEEITTENNFKEIVGSSIAMQSVFRQVQQVATSDTTVLIQGETGTGKELIARALHDSSPRREHPLIKLNCATLPPQLIESELFGHEKGSFTGALQKRIGKFELANNGTIFLDEIGEMPMNLQAKLLRVLQELEFERIGGNSVIKVNVRVIAATNRDLIAEIEAGRFRADLYYRLNVFPVQLPPLRARGEDIISLAQHFLQKGVRKIGKRISGISAAGLEELRSYHWPGNVRELEHVIERSILLNEGDRLDIILNRRGKAPVENHSANFQPKTFREAEREIILQTLQHSNGKVRGAGGAAEILDMHPSTLDSRMKKLGIRKQFQVTG